MRSLPVWLNTPYSMLQRWRDADRMPQAMLLVGTWRGHALHALIEQFLLQAYCQDANVCLRCQSCHWIQSKAHPDWIIIEGEGKAGDIGVEQVREVASLLQSQPQHAPFRMITIVDAHRLTESAANALLKVLEEPPARTHWCLQTDKPSQLLPTIRSRSIRLDCRSARTEMLHWLSSITNAPEHICQYALELAGNPIDAEALLKSEEKLDKLLEQFSHLSQNLYLDKLDNFIERHGFSFCLSGLALWFKKNHRDYPPAVWAKLTQLWWEFMPKIQSSTAEHGRQLLHELWTRWGMVLAKS